MRRRNLCNIVLFLLSGITAFAANDSIYMGTQLKLDIASPVIVPAANKWLIQNYEIAVNVRLAKRFYPTLEAGYAGGVKTQGDTIAYRGHGGFFRLGADINPLKKHPESPHALLIGLRVGTAVQESEQKLEGTRRGFTTGIRGDCWGEIVAGCQVEIAKLPPYRGGRGERPAFYMGWMGRFKVLFTRSQEMKVKPAITQEVEAKQAIAQEVEVKSAIAQYETTVNVPTPVYIPGYGNRDNIGWGVNYYIGWKF